MVHHAYSRISHNIAASATQRPRWRASLARSASSSTRMAASYRWRPRGALVSTAIVTTRPGSTRGVRSRPQVLHSRHSTCTHMHTCTLHMCTCRISQGWPQRAAAGLALLWCGLGAAAMPHLDPSPSDPGPTPTPIPPLLLTQVLLRCCCSASAAWERGCGAARRSTACAGEGEESGAGCTSTVCSHVQSQPPTGSGHLALRPRYAPPAP